LFEIWQVTTKNEGTDRSRPGDIQTFHLNNFTPHPTGTGDNDRGGTVLKEAQEAEVAATLLANNSHLSAEG
jgi:hypothetical protein